MLAIHGSIFVVTSLTLLGQSALAPPRLRVIMIYLALLVYGTWLFAVTLTTQRLDDISYARLRGIERQLGLEVHLYVGEMSR